MRKENTALGGYKHIAWYWYMGVHALGHWAGLIFNMIIIIAIHTIIHNVGVFIDIHYSRGRLPETRQFVQQLVQTNNKEIKV